MREQSASIGTVKELKIWLEGQFALLHQEQRNASGEILKLRDAVHEAKNQIAVIHALNVPGKLEEHTACLKEHDAEIEALKQANIAQKAAINAARATGVIIGGIAGTVVTLFLELWKVVHP